MSRIRPLQFAVVREDPAIEAEQARSVSARKILLIASGGCTALTLAAADPELEITLVDPNPAQLALVRRKLDALADVARADRARAFNIGADDEDALNGGGNFESLFRQFRGFLFEFVAPRARFAALFEGEGPTPAALEPILTSRYWPVAFDLFFADSILNAMFGPDATQHAPRGSYPGYFRRALERGLRAPGARDNYFLHHLLLGHYLDRLGCLPGYLTAPAPRPGQFRFVLGTLDQVGDLGEFDLIGLSNIFDWMPGAEIARTAARIAREARPGSALVCRQLNHTSELGGLFDGFAWEGARADRLLAADRSLFYSKLSLGVKEPGGRA